MNAKSIRPLVLVIALLTAATAGEAAVSNGNSLLDLPAVKMEAMADAKVVSEAPFQRSVKFNCNSDNTVCFASLPPVKENQRLEIQFVSCSGGIADDGTLASFFMQVTDASVTKNLGFHYIAPSYIAPAPPYFFLVSQPMVLTVGETNILHLAVHATGRVSVNNCWLSGLRQKLK